MLVVDALGEVTGEQILGDGFHATPTMIPMPPKHDPSYYENPHGGGMG